MVREDLDRPLALVLSRFPAQARGRLIQILPPPVREKVADLQGTVTDLPRSEMTFVEQVLHADLEAVFTEEDDSEARLFSEALPLRVSDVIALLLKHTTPQQAAEAVLRLPPALQGEVLHKVAAQDWGVLERRLGRAEVAFLEAMESAWDASAVGADPRFVAEVLRRLQAPGAVRRLLTEMHRMDPESADAVRDRLYGFEEMVRLTDLELQTVLTGIDHWDLVLALRSAPLGLRRRVLANISERRARYLAEDEEVLEEMDEAQVHSVQHRIVERVRQLYEAGKVHTYFGSVGGDEEAGAAAEDEAPVEPSGSRSDLPEEPVRRRFDLRGAVIGLGGIALGVLLLIWFTGVRSTSPPSGVRTAQPAMIGDTDVQRDGLRKGGKRPRSRGEGGALPDVALVEGQVYLVSGESKRPAEGETLRPGDRVETDAGGRAIGSPVGRIRGGPGGGEFLGADGGGRADPGRCAPGQPPAGKYLGACDRPRPGGEVAAGADDGFRRGALPDARCPGRHDHAFGAPGNGLDEISRGGGG